MMIVNILLSVGVILLGSAIILKSLAIKSIREYLENEWFKKKDR